MKIAIKFDKSGAQLVNPRKFESDVSKGVNTALVNAGNYILGEIQKATPVGATGIMRRNWYLETSKVGLNALVEVEIKNQISYLDTVNSGRKAAPVSMEGKKSLALWVQRKLHVSDPKKAMSIAYAIAAKKKKNDTPGQKFIEGAIDEALPIAVSQIIEPGIQKAIDDAAAGK